MFMHQWQPNGYPNRCSIQLLALHSNCIFVMHHIILYYGIALISLAHILVFDMSRGVGIVPTLL